MVDLVFAFSLGVLASEFPSVRVPILTLLPIAGAILGATRKSLSQWLTKEKSHTENVPLPKLPVFKKPPMVTSNVQDLHIADVFPPNKILSEDLSSNATKAKAQNPWKVDVPAVPAVLSVSPAEISTPEEEDESNVFVNHLHKTIPNPWIIDVPTSPTVESESQDIIPDSAAKETSEGDADEEDNHELEEGEVDDQQEEEQID